MSISLSKSLRAKKVEVIAYLRIFYFISITKKKKKMKMADKARKGMVDAPDGMLE
jgi:hypothetical protein